MNDTFLMRMLDGSADLYEQLQSLFYAQLLLMAVFGDEEPSTSSITK